MRNTAQTYMSVNQIMKGEESVLSLRNPPQSFQWQPTINDRSVETQTLLNDRKINRNYISLLIWSRRFWLVLLIFKSQHILLLYPDLFLCETRYLMRTHWFDLTGINWIMKRGHCVPESSDVIVKEKRKVRDVIWKGQSSQKWNNLFILIKHRFIWGHL